MWMAGGFTPTLSIFHPPSCATHGAQSSRPRPRCRFCCGCSLRRLSSALLQRHPMTASAFQLSSVRMAHVKLSSSGTSRSRSSGHLSRDSLRQEDRVVAQYFGDPLVQVL